MAPDDHRTRAINPLMVALAVLHPFFFAVAFILDRFALTNSSAHELTRPLVVAVLIAALLLLAGWAVFRRAPSAALFASTAFLVLAFHPFPALVMLGAGTWWILVANLRRRRSGTRPPLQLSDLPVLVAVGYSVLLLAAGLWSAGSALTPKLASDIELAVPTDGGEGGPDVYLLVLDGYPRSDTLAEEFGFDNTAFEAELGDLGFRTSPVAEANYNKTWLTIASILNAAYVQDLPELADPPDSAPAQARLAEELINAGAVLDVLRLRGYEIISIPSSVPSTDVTAGVDVRQVPNLNSLEIALVTSSLPSWLASDPVLDFLAADVRAYADNQMRLLREAAAERAEAPRLVMTHLMQPHPPFVLGQEPDYLDGCFPGCKIWETTVDETGMADEAYAARMRIQVEELNRLVIETLREVVAIDPDATMVVMSDHGARHHLDGTDEHFRILFAARGGELGVEFPDDASPVNLFRRILTSAFDADLPDLSYQAWASDWHLPLTVTRHH